MVALVLHTLLSYRSKGLSWEHSGELSGGQGALQELNAYEEHIIMRGSRNLDTLTLFFFTLLEKYGPGWALRQTLPHLSPTRCAASGVLST